MQGFWDDPDSAQKHLQKVARLREFVEPWEAVRAHLADLETLLELGLEEEDESVEPEIAQGLESARDELHRLEMAAILSGEHDASDAILSINAGAGGDEACDWAEMLLRMYLRWADRHSYQHEIISFVPGEVAGARNVTAEIRGTNAYGFLRAESGVHRLVRISPFDANKRRHTSFAAVDVIPAVDEAIPVEIRDDDLQIDTYRASGAGGQHVNKTDSAVRITHKPTGIIASCQNERSQHANKRTAMNHLRARLFELERRKQQEEIAKLRGDLGENRWGHQIRSYVLQPYTMIKDLRTNVETGNVQAVLDGDLDQFIHAYLQQMAGKDGNGKG